MTNKCLQSGVCCTLFAINLSEEEYNSGKYKTEFEEFGLLKDFTKAELYGANIIKQNKDGSCSYLKNKKCSIHNTRPKVCRAFFCNSKEEQFKDMIKDVKEKKESLKNKV